MDSETLPFLPSRPTVTLRTLHLDRWLIKANTLKVPRIRVLVECVDPNVGHFEKLIETPGFDPTLRDVPLNVVASGDVRVSIFEELNTNMSCFENINTGRWGGVGYHQRKHRRPIMSFSSRLSTSPAPTLPLSLAL